ncbi:unnamed protein product [Ranitomeya imitator]|uniref:Uncharacterized protein n=1 Tax=Ranitomeya imitator TaxID=111125 RepID=A0ABN9MF94_9NEOB|nr:unnamed protein product [Ranitomeya imitator]
MTPWFTCSSKHKFEWQTADWNKYDERLMRSAERGDVDKISSTLSKKGVNPSKLDLEGRSAFHVVASKGHLECLNAILLHGVDLTAPDGAGTLPGWCGVNIHYINERRHVIARPEDLHRTEMQQGRAEKNHAYKDGDKEPCLQGRGAMHKGLSNAYKDGDGEPCIQGLRFNCPTENVDLQGRTALHDAGRKDPVGFGYTNVSPSYLQTSGGKGSRNQCPRQAK